MSVQTVPSPSLEIRTDGPILAVIPAYNEDRFVASVVLKARHFVDAVIVVDDGSTDETALLAQEAGATVIRQPSNSGKAAALNAGLTVARERDARAVVLLDGDGQHRPADIPALLRPILDGQADMVIGSRFIGAASNTPPWRIAGQRALTAATNFASGVALSDSQTGFRALSRKAVASLHFRTSGFSVESEMQFLIKRHDLAVCEVAIAVNYDEGPKRNPVAHGLQVLNGILRMIGQNRPLFFFGVPGTLIITVGLILGFVVVDNYNRYSATQGSGALAVGTALVSVTLILVGVFTVFTGIILHTIRAYMTG
ncbi:MAG TPA: glycosyltransferase family 2 protein [Aggregatilineales bacterium]|nr:glycosyltransferase family 2 protein [Aggregatilineales bacterium]